MPAGRGHARRARGTITGMTESGKQKTAAATAANRRRREERMATELRERGWIVLDVPAGEKPRVTNKRIQDAIAEQRKATSS